MFNIHATYPTHIWHNGIYYLLSRILLLQRLIMIWSTIQNRTWSGIQKKPKKRWSYRSVLFFGRGNFYKEQLTEKTPWYIHVPLDVVLNTYLLNT